MLFDAFLIGYSVVCVIIAVILNVKLPRNFTYHFYFVCVLFLIMFGGIGFSLQFPLPEDLHYILTKIIVFLYSLFPFFFLHFIIVYVGSIKLLQSKFIISAIYVTGLFGYVLMLLGYIPQPTILSDSQAGLDTTGYVFFITWMSILFALGVAKLYALVGGYHNRDYKSRFLFIGFIVLFLALPGPFTETILDEIFGKDIEWYFFSSFFGLGIAVYFIFRHKITNTLYDSLKSTFSIMDDILIRVDSKYRIEMIRGAITPLLGYNEKELIGKPMSFLVENYDMSSDPAEDTEEEKEKLFYYYAKSKDGKQVPMNFTFAPIMDDQHVTGYIGIGRDFTERKQIESELIQAKKDAENSNRLKTEFLAQMSHEIRTPLNIVVNYSLLLSDELKDMNNESVNNAIVAINNASDRIVRTVDLVLNMSEIQLGIYEKDPKEFDLVADVLKKLIIIYEKKAKDKGLEFNVTNKTEEAVIYADEYSIEEIFTNLLDNAIKFTESGLIELTISNTMNDKIQVEVVDTGIGIDRSYIKHLYEPFTQELHGYSRKYEGNGLGLSVVKKFCDLNNAVIQVDTEKDVGTTFRVTLGRNSEV